MAISLPDWFAKIGQERGVWAGFGSRWPELEKLNSWDSFGGGSNQSALAQQMT